MILADTGFWVALAYPGDVAHPSARAAFVKHGHEELVTTWPVLTETVHLIRQRYTLAAALRFIGDVASGACTIMNPPVEALPQLHALMQKYRDLPMDLADASLVWLAEELGEGRILSTDLRDFGAYRWKSRKPFKNLLIAVRS